MNDVVSTFPLLRLPKDAILHTLRIMHFLQIFGMSLLSKRTKNLVESSKITAGIFQVVVSDRFEIELFFPPTYSRLHFKLYHVRENQPPQELGTPGNIHIRNGTTNVSWTNEMSVKELLDHLKFIFHGSMTMLYFRENCERFSLESVHESVKDFRNIFLLSGNHEHNRKILSLFRPTHLMLGPDTLVDERIPSNFLIQNFVIFHVVNVRITLNELLMANSRVIDLVCQELSVRIINQLLKLWVKRSNSRLECLLLWLVPNFRTEELFEGLSYKNAPCNRVRLFNKSAEKKIEKLVGGWDIWRFDGTKATIIVHRNQSVVFKLFVWHDHCIVD